MQEKILTFRFNLYCKVDGLNCPSILQKKLTVSRLGVDKVKPKVRFKSFFRIDYRTVLD